MFIVIPRFCIAKQYRHPSKPEGLVKGSTDYIFFNSKIAGRTRYARRAMTFSFKRHPSLTHSAAQGMTFFALATLGEQ